MTLKPLGIALAMSLAGGAIALAATTVTTVPAINPATTPSVNILAHHGFIVQTRRKGEDTEAYFEVDNSGDTPDTVTAWKCPLADVTMLVDAKNQPVARLDVPARGSLKLSLAGIHLVLRNIHFQVSSESMVPCALTFQDAGMVGVMLYPKPRVKS